jgi:hypothetical protein
VGARKVGREIEWVTREIWKKTVNGKKIICTECRKERNGELRRRWRKK